MARTALVVPLATSVTTVGLPAPRINLGFWECVALGLRARVDRIGTRSVSDDHHTHSLRRILSEHRRAEAEVVRLADSVISLLAVAIAEADAESLKPVEARREPPTTTTLAGLSGAERLRWADSRREAEAANGRANAADRATGQARLLATRYRIEIANVQAESEDVRRQWREAYSVRAAQYTRARFGFFGPRMAEVPAVAGYEFGEGLHLDRSPK